MRDEREALREALNNLERMIDRCGWMSLIPMDVRDATLAAARQALMTKLSSPESSKSTTTNLTGPGCRRCGCRPAKDDLTGLCRVCDGD